MAHKSVRMAGNRIDEAITQHIRKKYNLIIGEQTAEMGQNKIRFSRPVVREEENGSSGPGFIFRTAADA